jgi:glycosyltransferase involved in cell wall biosynthesis
MSANSRMPLVSILIPAFNSSKWIADTIRSAIGQTWPRKEIIVVDDGSTDETLSIARRFASREVSVVTQPNQGAAVARNTALSVSQGDFIQWLDADDLLAPDKIARQMDAGLGAAGARTLLSSASGSFIHRAADARFTASPLWCNLSPVEWLVRKLKHNAYMQTGTWLVHRQLTSAAGPWDTRLSCDDDGEYFARLVAASDGVWFVPEARVMYRMSGPGSLSVIGDADDAKLASLLLSMRLHVQYLRGLEDNERVRTACIEYLQRNSIFFYPRRGDLVAQLHDLAADLGGRLDVPRLPWKYECVRTVFGWTIAKRLQFLAPWIRWSITGRWDRLLARRRGGAPATLA